MFVEGGCVHAHVHVYDACVYEYECTEKSIVQSDSRLVSTSVDPRIMTCRL